jgi:hypothetical protein
MNGDFTRNTFDPEKHFTRVLMQQGRVQLDADWNEQAAILLHYLQTLAADLIGPFGGPGWAKGPDGLPIEGFKINLRLENQKLADLMIGEGHYYVDGILCENSPRRDSMGVVQDVRYYAQPDYRIDPRDHKLPEGNFLVYLDVWERLITSYEDNSLREVALGGPDTAGRAKVVWQVKCSEKMPNGDTIPTDDFNQDDWKEWIKTRWTGFADWQPANRGLLKIKAKEDTTQNPDACAVPPGARYRGNENQLYRIEIHRGGSAETATFKWSRDNGSVVFPIRALNGTTAYLDHLGRDERLSLKEGDWVEIVDDSIAAQYQANNPGRLAQVEKLNLLDMTVILKTPNGAALPSFTENGPGHPLLRRWDYQQSESRDSNVPSTDNDGALPVEENTWLTLENGIQVYFANLSANEPNVYRTGDYWLAAARTATGDVEGSKETDDQGNVITDNLGNPVPKLVRPHGVTHHYAPLAIVSAGAITDVRNVFCPIEPCEPSDERA